MRIRAQLPHSMIRGAGLEVKPGQGGAGNLRLLRIPAQIGNCAASPACKRTSKGEIMAYASTGGFRSRFGLAALDLRPVSPQE